MSILCHFGDQRQITKKNIKMLSVHTRYQTKTNQTTYTSNKLTLDYIAAQTCNLIKHYKQLPVYYYYACSDHSYWVSGNSPLIHHQVRLRTECDSLSHAPHKQPQSNYIKQTKTQNNVNKLHNTITTKVTLSECLTTNIYDTAFLSSYRSYYPSDTLASSALKWLIDICSLAVAEIGMITYHTITLQLESGKNANVVPKTATNKLTKNNSESKNNTHQLQE